jgi:lysozyme
MDAVELAAALCRRFEGFFSHPYLCPAGVPTIGYGATYYEDGRKVTLRDPPITRERAEELLQNQIRRRFLPAVARLCPGADSDGRVAALIDFAFNLGDGNLAASTLRRKVNDGAWDEVAYQFMRWNRAGGVVLKGLTRRRAAEVEHVQARDV